MKPKRVSFLTLFNTRRVVVAVMLGIVIYFWAIFFLPAPVIEWITKRVQMAGDVLSPVFGMLGTSALSLLAFFVIGEPLAHGGSRAALFYQDQFPSKKLATQFNVDRNLASNYFLKYYDCWQFDSEPEHLEYLQTTQLRFACLFDFLIKRLLIILLLLSLLALAYEVILRPIDGARIAAEGTFVFVMAFLLVMFSRLNAVPSASSGGKGCWKAWADQNARNYSAYLAARGAQSLPDFDKANQTRLESLIKASQS
jgi:hypothetical protein